MRLGDKIISSLDLQGLDEDAKREIASELVALAVEKTLDDILKRMGQNKAQELQKYISKDPKDLPEIYGKYGDDIKDFFIIFNKSLNESLREFRNRARKPA